MNAINSQRKRCPLVGMSANKLIMGIPFQWRVLAWLQIRSDHSLPRSSDLRRQEVPQKNMLTLGIEIGSFLLQVLDSVFTISLKNAATSDFIAKPLLSVAILTIDPWQENRFFSSKQQEDILEQSLFSPWPCLFSCILFAYSLCVGVVLLLIHFLPWKPGSPKSSFSFPLMAEFLQSFL